MSAAKHQHETATGGAHSLTRLVRVPVSLGELYGPVKCDRCARIKSFTIWTTEAMRQLFTRQQLIEDGHGESLCNDCRAANS